MEISGQEAWFRFFLKWFSFTLGSFKAIGCKKPAGRSNPGLSVRTGEGKPEADLREVISQSQIPYIWVVI